jgi:hypothetical protein
VIKGTMTHCDTSNPNKAVNTITAKGVHPGSENLAGCGGAGNAEDCAADAEEGVLIRTNCPPASGAKGWTRRQQEKPGYFPPHNFPAQLFS